MRLSPRQLRGVVEPPADVDAICRADVAALGALAEDRADGARHRREDGLRLLHRTEAVFGALLAPAVGVARLVHNLQLGVVHQRLQDALHVAHGQ
eukprot:6199654-Pleurochrysis_carterae.AAC.5